MNYNSPEVDALRILLVEDSRADARLIEILLRNTSSDIQLEHVSSMQAAVHALADGRYDAALLDLGLPDGFGLENIQRIKGLSPELPIIIMTGLDDAQTAAAARAHGAVDYLVKGSVAEGEELLAQILVAIGDADAAANGPATLTATLEQNQQAGIETDINGVITFWDDDAAKVTGFPAEAMLGQLISTIIPKPRQDEIALLAGRLRRKENVREFETVRKHASGGEIEVSLSAFPLLDEQDNVRGSRTVLRDITELKRDRADAMQLAAIVASTTDAIIGCTLDGVITHWNPGAKGTLGFTEDQAQGLQIKDLVTEEDRPYLQQMLAEARRGNTAPRHDGRLHHQQGHPVDMSITISPVRDRGGGLVGAAMLASDITERKAAEIALEHEIDEHAAANAELRETLERLRDAQGQLVQAEKLASLGGLVAGVAHEINTPIGVGVTAASHLRRRLEETQTAYQSGQLKRSQLESFVADADQASQIVITNLHRAAELIASFKQVAVDQSSSEPRRFNLRKYLDEILLSLRPRLKKSAVDVRVECDDLLELDSIPGVFSQVITNLLLNSLIHAYDEDDTGTIKIQARCESNGFKLDYSDDGKGMTAETLARVFDPFFTTRRGKGGSGLGMHVVYNLITQKLGGQVKVDSAPGQGMHFSMSMPLQQAESA